MTDVLFTESEQEFVHKWAHRWCQLFDLVFKLLRPDIVEVLTEQDEVSYQSLRNWFIENQEPFLPLWQDYFESQKWSLDTNEDLISGIRSTERALKNLFFELFEFDDLNALVSTFLNGSSIDRRNSKKDTDTAIIALFQLDLVALEFVTWVFGVDEPALGV